MKKYMHKLSFLLALTLFLSLLSYNQPTSTAEPKPEDVGLSAVISSSATFAQGLGATETKLTASDAAPYDSFGISVSIDGDTAVVGARGDDDAGEDSGSAYVFVRSGTSWTEQAKLTASDAVAGDAFGISVSIDGDTAVVGAYGDDDAGLASGSAYVFVRSASASFPPIPPPPPSLPFVNPSSELSHGPGGPIWLQQAKLTASDGAADDWFGISVSISGDTAVIGSVRDDDAGPASGSAYVFVRRGSHWIQRAKLTASDGTENDWLGLSVSISGDTAVIGAVGDTFPGAAYLFEKPIEGWADMTETAKLTASDGVVADFFAMSVSISGNAAVIGAPFEEDDVSGSAAGSAYLFEKPTGGWADMTETAKLTASDRKANDNLGGSVWISGDMAVISAIGDTFPGAAYVFEKPAGGWADMTETAKLTASDAKSGDWFGGSVSLNGGAAVVGARFDDDAGLDSGSAYVFELRPLTLEERLLALREDVEAIVTDGTPGSFWVDVLIQKLQLAESLLAQFANLGEEPAAHAQLEASVIEVLYAFIDDVEIFINVGWLPLDEGTSLIDAVHEIIDRL